MAWLELAQFTWRIVSCNRLQLSRTFPRPKKVAFAVPCNRRQMIDSGKFVIIAAAFFFFVRMHLYFICFCFFLYFLFVSYCNYFFLMLTWVHSYFFYLVLFFCFSFTGKWRKLKKIAKEAKNQMNKIGKGICMLSHLIRIKSLWIWTDHTFVFIILDLRNAQH